MCCQLVSPCSHFASHFVSSFVCFCSLFLVTLIEVIFCPLVLSFLSPSAALVIVLCVYEVVLFHTVVILHLFVVRSCVSDVTVCLLVVNLCLFVNLHLFIVV